jgi:hypothetical protein
METSERIRLALSREGSSYFNSPGVPFKQRPVPDDWFQGILEIWRQACFYSPVGDTNAFYPTVVRLDENGKPHGKLEFSDGLTVCFVHGIEVPTELYEHPERITQEIIDACHYPQLRNVPYPELQAVLNDLRRSSQ